MFVKCQTRGCATKRGSEDRRMWREIKTSPVTGSVMRNLSTRSADRSVVLSSGITWGTVQKFFVSPGRKRGRTQEYEGASHSPLGLGR